MAKIRVDAVGYDESNYNVMVTLIETQTIEEVETDVPLGEASIRFPSDTEIADVKQKIIKAAEGIWKAHKNAQDKRHDIAELDFPPIP